MTSIKKELFQFVSITLSATCILGILTWYKGGFDDLAQSLTLYILAIVVMMLYKLKFKKPVFENGDLGFRFTGWKYWFIAPLVLTLLCLSSYLISYVFDPNLFVDIETLKASLASKGFYLGSIFTSMIVISLLNCVVGSIINITNRSAGIKCQTLISLKNNICISNICLVLGIKTSCKLLYVNNPNL